MTCRNRTRAVPDRTGAARAARRGAGLLLALGCGGGPGGPALNDELARVLAEVRPYALRLASADWKPCESGSAVRCGAPVDPELLDRMSGLAVRAQRAAAESGDAGALHVLAMIDLVTASDARMMDRSIVQLREVEARQGEGAALSNELAVAYALRAEHEGDPQDLYRALDEIERAVALDSASAIVAFNRALILDRLHLTGESAAAWQAAGRKEVEAAWLAEVESRSAPADGDAAEWFGAHVSSWQGSGGSGLDSAVIRFPQVAREYAQDVLLPAWGSERQTGTGESAVLRTAAAIGESLRRARGDATIEEAVAAIRTADSSRRLRLAQGWSAYGAGRAQFREADLNPAAVQLDRALAEFRSADPQALRWARLYRALITMYRFDYAAAESELTQLRSAGDTLSRRAFAARVEWALGFSRTRRGAAGEAVPHLEASVLLARAAGEAESEAATHLILSEALGALGRTRAAALATQQAAALYRSYRGATSLHSLLLVTGRRLAETGLPFAGVAVNREGLRVAAATGRAKDPIEAHTWLARAQLDAGALAEAARSLDEAEQRLPALADTLMRTRLRMEGLAARAQLELAADPRQGIERITPVVAYYEAGQLAFGLRDALSRRAHARLQLGDVAGALADNTRVIEALERQLSSLAAVGARAALLDSAAAAFDGVISIHAAAADTERALEYAERSRALFPGDGTRGSPGDRVSRLRDSIPDGVVILEYAALPDRLLVWAVARGIITFGESPVTAADLATRIERFVNLIRIGADSAVVQALGTELWSFLIGPVRTALQGSPALVIVADRALHGVPFGALRSPAGRYLIQEHVLQGAPSAGFVVGAADVAAWPPAPRLLAAGNATADATAFPDLDPLPHVTRELAEVAAQYENAVRLDAQGATKRALLQHMPRADIVHFAGHARLRPDRPDQSFLVVTPEPGAQGTVSGSDIAALDLRGLQLAILSACATLAPAGTRNGGLSGLAHSFLAAGAGGVIGTLWEVADASTAGLMVELHRGLRRGASPAEALRSAQLALITSTDPRLRQPSAWSAFRYEGR